MTMPVPSMWVSWPGRTAGCHVGQWLCLLRADPLGHGELCPQLPIDALMCLSLLLLLLLGLSGAGVPG